jgi:hypothetical protein
MERVYAEGDTIVIIDMIPTPITGAQETKYESAMTDDETIAQAATGIRTVCFLDPNGEDRNFNPSGTFTAGYEIVVINKGANLITFDSVGIAVSIAFAEKVHFFYNGTSWY